MLEWNCCVNDFFLNQIYKRQDPTLSNIIITSVLEQSCVVWNYNITKKNKHELESVQTVVLRLISFSNESYVAKLKEFNLETLKDIRNKLSEKFAKMCED